MQSSAPRSMGDYLIENLKTLSDQRTLSDSECDFLRLFVLLVPGAVEINDISIVVSCLASKPTHTNRSSKSTFESCAERIFSENFGGGDGKTKN